MKKALLSTLLAFLGLAALTQPASAASSKKEKEAAKTAALISALQAVSPDPLGGRLGLAATSPRSESPVTTTTAGARKDVTRLDVEQRAYVVWKNSQKS
jgi:hypothetical protein